MKKILLSILILISIDSFAQNIDTAKASLTLRLREWEWVIGKKGAGDDSISAARVRVLRNAVIAAGTLNPDANITVNNVPGNIIMDIYRIYLNSSVGDMLNLGTNTAQRLNILTTIRAITNDAIQAAIVFADQPYIDANNGATYRGAIILIHN